MLKEKEEIEKVRNMTEEERREWERKNPKPAAPPKQKWRFMQKYFHKGAFFQSNRDDQSATVGADNIYTRDYSAPTGEDIRWTRQYYPKLCKSSTLVVVEELSGPIWLMRIVLIGTTRGHAMTLFGKNTMRKWQR